MKEQTPTIQHSVSALGALQRIITPHLWKVLVVAALCVVTAGSVFAAQDPGATSANRLGLPLPLPTNTPLPLPTATATATPTPCSIAFADVPPGNPFYAYIRCLACQGILNGYTCGGPGEPCNPARESYFRPGANVTRGQVAKIVANSAALADPIPSGQQTFTDVATGSPFWPYVERMSVLGVISGYECGGPGEPCDPALRPYFRPSNDVTRGQLAKIIANTAGYAEPATGQTFADVGPTDPFYSYVERMALHGTISGYTCGGPGEPCDPQRRPYFRTAIASTRSQTAKIDTNTFFPSCGAPGLLAPRP